jgi:hypothetical protein
MAGERFPLLDAITEEVIQFNGAFEKEIIEIYAVTGSNSFYGVKSKKEEYFEERIDLVAWKFVNSDKIYNGNYILTTKADRDYKNELRKKILPDSIVLLKVRQKENKFLLVEILKNKNIDKKLKEVFPEQALKYQNINKETETNIRVLVEFKSNGNMLKKELMLLNVREQTKEAIRAIETELQHQHPNQEIILWNTKWLDMIPEWKGLGKWIITVPMGQ